MRIFFLIGLLSYFGIAQETFIPQKTKVSKIVVDGKLDPDEWENAIQIDLDIEFNPANNQAARKQTIAYITYSNRYVFIGVYAKDNPSNIRASIRPRDDFNIWNDDLILVRLDPYADSRNNLGLAVNALGSQFDVKQVNALTDEGRYDSSFNVNFESAGTIVSDGYQIEMKIPLSEIPFPNGKNQMWHFNFYRRYVENGNEIEVSSQPRDRNNSCVVCQTTDRLILKDIVIDKRLEFLPYFSSNVSGERDTSDEKLKYGKPNFGIGLGVNMDLNKNTSLEITINPDFSQVEADVTQIDVNSSFSLLYPERRPFFNRGADLINFTDGAFYSRSISEPIVASKIISQGKKSRLLLLNALDNSTPYLVGGEDRSFNGNGGRSFVNVFRYQKLISNKSRIGTILTNRFYNGGGYGHLLGFDGLFLLNKKWRLSFELFKNINQEPVEEWIDSTESIQGKTVALDGDNLNGDAIYFQLYRNTEHWESYFFYRNISPQYRADLGFVVKNNRRWGTLFHKYQNILNKPGLQSFGFGTKIDVVYTFEDLYKNFSVDFFAFLTTFGQTELRYTLDYDAVKTFLEIRFNDLPTNELILSGKPSESINFRINLTAGKDLSVNEVVPEVGLLRSAYLTFGIQLNDNLNINPSWRYSRLERTNGGEDFFEGSIARMSIRYQFNKAFNIRVIAEKNSFNDQFFVQPLFQWNPNPSTIFYFGGNQTTLENLEDAHFQILQFNRSQFFVKFQYLIN
tara:strand:+ start:5410 stop:7626 length:2217 start_codon:yes stop_codon:yes gene_type:complete